jgi:hypothetical protein
MPTEQEQTEKVLREVGPSAERGGIFIVLFEDGKQVRVVVEPETEERGVLWFAVREGDHLARYEDGRRLVRCFSSAGPYAALGVYISSAAGCCGGNAVVEWWRDGEKSRNELLAEIDQVRTELARRR